MAGRLQRCSSAIFRPPGRWLAWWGCGWSRCRVGSGTAWRCRRKAPCGAGAAILAASLAALRPRPAAQAGRIPAIAAPAREGLAGSRRGGWRRRVSSRHCLTCGCARCPRVDCTPSRSLAGGRSTLGAPGATASWATVTSPRARCPCAWLRSAACASAESAPETRTRWPSQRTAACTALGWASAGGSGTATRGLSTCRGACRRCVGQRCWPSRPAHTTPSR
mmetsp:Transcript_11647/g.38393  ORF Transcript_11647/g.38393 Transcript_11647/m.38393 type:complete len:221 (-) Transcript_11647:308-970(-)